MPTTALPRHPLTRGLADAAAALDGLADLPLWSARPEDLTDMLDAASRLLARVESVRLAVITAGDRADAGSATGTTTAGWVRHTTRVDRHAAKRLVDLSRSLRRLEATRTALTAGDLSLAHARVVATTLEELPTSLGPRIRRDAEAELVARSAEFDPLEVRRLGRRILDVVAPHVADRVLGARVAAEDAAADRATQLTLRNTPDGVLTYGTFTLPRAVGDMLRANLNALASPRRPKDEAYERSTPDGSKVLNCELMGRAFTEWIERVPADSLPTTGGVNATLVVSIPLTTLTGGLRPAELLSGHELSAGQARRLSCEAGLIPLVLGGESQPLDLGRTQRLHTPAQRLAIHHRDKTCRAEDCDTPATWCHIHHQTPWSRGGSTSVADGITLCSRHHHLVHHDHWAHERTPQGRIRFTRLRP